MAHEVYLGNRINQIVLGAENGNRDRLMSIISRAKDGLGPDKEKVMAELILSRLRHIPKDDYEAHIKAINGPLLESLACLNTIGIDMHKLLLSYSQLIHRIPGAKNGDGEFISEDIREHLARVGLVIATCSSQEYRAGKGHGTHGLK